MSGDDTPVLIRQGDEITLTTFAAFATDNGDDPEMVAAVREAVEAGTTFRGGGGAGVAFEVIRAELPEIDEMAGAITEAVAASDAYRAAHPDDPDIPDDETGRHWKQSFFRLADLSDRIEAGLSQFSANHGANDAR